MEYQFTEQEQQVRKKWLLATKLICLVQPAVGCIVMFALFYFDHSWENYFFTTLGSFFLNVLLYFFIKHCTYKKYGTIVTTILIVLTGIGLAIPPFSFKSFTEIFIWLASLGVYSWWVYASIKLKPINLKAGFWKDSLEAFER